MKIHGSSNDLLLISVKPQFAKKIFKGEKTVELRKSAPLKAKKGSYLLIYVTSPVKELWGICKIDNIISGNPKMLWNRIGAKTGISKNDFFSYYSNSNNAYGIEISDVKSFNENSIKLECLKNMFPGFSPPQTYRYLKRELVNESQLAIMIE